MPPAPLGWYYDNSWLILIISCFMELGVGAKQQLWQTWLKIRLCVCAYINICACKLVFEKVCRATLHFAKQFGKYILYLA